MPFDLTGWMGSVDGSAQLSKISIPGTHDSASRYIDPVAHTVPFDPSPRLTTQTDSIRDQLNAGIRFLDIRVGYTQNQFRVYHENVYLNLTFGDVRDICRTFLQENKRETIILSLKKEDDAPTDGNSPGVTFQQRFNTYYSESPNLWYLNNEIPVLRDVRGKIVLFRRFQLDTNQPAAPAPQNPGINAFNDFPDNETGTIDGPPKLIIQDKFSQTISKAAKWTAVQQLLNQASGNQGSDVLYVNFASAAGTAPVDFPLSVANYINPRLINYLNGKRGRFGIVPMDFQTRELNTLIIQTNGG